MSFEHPTAGELAEQRHLLDGLDHRLEHLADAYVPPAAPCICYRSHGLHFRNCAEYVPPRQAEDPHDSPLHHTYALGRELPVACACGHTARTHRPGGCIADAYHSGLLGLCGCTLTVTA